MMGTTSFTGLLARQGVLHMIINNFHGRYVDTNYP